MFSSKQKKVHYERGTKGGKSSHGHRSSGSRDSGVGSSSASDRASLGTSPEEDSPYGIVEDQRYDISAVQNALNAANEKIRRLEAANTQLDQELMDSNKENRLLKREKGELLKRVEGFEEDLADERKSNERSRRDATPRTGTGTSSSTRTERRSTPPKREAKEAKESESRRRGEESSQGSRDRRSSWREFPAPLYDRPIHTERPPTAPYPPSSNASNPFTPIANSNPNPFLPNSTRPPSVTYAPSSVSYAGSTAVTYAPAPLAYTTAPAFTPPRSGPNFPNDGKYHPYPLQ